jgi:hypothetical protein
MFDALSFPLVGNPSEERLRTSRSDRKQGMHYTGMNTCDSI